MCLSKPMLITFWHTVKTGLVPVAWIGQHGHLTLCMLGSISYFCYRLLTFLFKIYLTLLECKTVWIQIRTDVIALVLVRVLAVYKGYQQMTKIAFSKERVNEGFREYMGLDVRLSVIGVWGTTKAQTSLPAHSDQRLCCSGIEKYHI